MLKPFPLVNFRCEHFFDHFLLIGVDLFMNIVFLQDFILFNMIWVQCYVTFAMLNCKGGMLINTMLVKYIGLWNKHSSIQLMKNWRIF